MTINESVENYLETILILSHKSSIVRSIDVATELNFKKPSVSVAMKNLREKEYITMTTEGYIHLTEAGKKIAAMVYEKTYFSFWLVRKSRSRC
ncbi:Mn-dependent DtxR family transcriptional regulator [Clostridium saccharobutylicum]|nr:Mn-dependent DtxR family transcriptional regulator [Clostridium saccharobutylicum]